MSSEKQSSASGLVRVRKAIARYFTDSVVKLLVRISVTPNTLTWFGFILAVVAGWLIISGSFFAAGIVVLLAGFFDILDGALARATNQTTRFGAVLDATLDRFSEAVLFFSIIVFYALRADERLVLLIALVGVTVVGSFMVSYIRARAESLGLDCQVGLFTRAERVIILTLGLWLNQLVIALAIILVVSFITVVQRLFHVWRQTEK